MKDFANRFVLLGMAVIVTGAFFDNVRGPLLPLFSKAYGLNYTQAAAFFWASSATSFIVSMLSVPLLARWTERTYVRAAVAVQIGAVALAGGGCYPSLIASGLLWGLGNTAISMSSNLVAIRGTDDSNRSRVMTGLHLFYCLGSIVPAFYVSKTAGTWPLPAIVLPTMAILLALGACTFAMPSGTEAAPAARMPWAAMLRPHALTWNLAISVYITGEVLTGMWLVTYLTGGASLGVADASGFLQMYFLCMASSRALGAVFFKAGSERALPAPLMLASVACLGLGLSGWTPGFWLAAFCFGPMFPLMAAGMVKDYPREYPSLIAFMYGVCTVLLALGHAALGLVSDRFSVQAAFRIPALCVAAAFLLTLLLRALSPPRSSPA